MRGWYVVAVGLSLLLALFGCAGTERLTAPSSAPPLYGRVYRPVSQERHPGVIFLHGVYGIHPDQNGFARRLADRGYVVLVLDYYRGLDPSGERNWETYSRVVRQAVLYQRGLPGVDPGRIGLVGFSQGAFLAVLTAGAEPAVKAVVSFYGGAPRDLDRYIHLLPPTLILHGEADDDVPVASAYRLRDAMVRQGRIVDMQVYPGVRHSFGQAGLYSDARAAQDAEARAVSFLDRHLRGE